MRWGGVKELTKTPLMQANSQVFFFFFLPTLLHLGSLHFNTPLKPQITIFWQHKCSSWRVISLETEIGTCRTWLPALGFQIRWSAGVLYIIAISCAFFLCCRWYDPIRYTGGKKSWKVKLCTVKAFTYDMFVKTVIFLSNTADIHQTKGGNNEQFAHLKSLRRLAYDW